MAPPLQFYRTFEDEGYTRILNENDLGEYLGYLVVDSQPVHSKGPIRNANGLVPGKPLKGRKEITECHAKTVVIHDEALWKELIELHNEKIHNYHAREYGGDLKDSLIFDQIHRSKSSIRLKNAYKDLGLKYKSCHCLRHTRATLLMGNTGDDRHCRIWLGHISDKVL